MLRLLVTVGTTKFDDLIKAFGINTVRDCLTQQGITHCILQIGGGESLANNPQLLGPDDGFDQLSGQDGGWGVLTYSNQLPSLMSQADIIIAHCGAGTTIEALQLKKPLLVVSNPTLMDDHQQELGDALNAAGLVVYVNGMELRGKYSGLLTGIEQLVERCQQQKQENSERFNVWDETVSRFEAIAEATVGRPLFLRQPDPRLSFTEAEASESAVE